MGVSGESGEQVLDRLEDGVGMTEVHCDVSGVDKADLAAGY
jgi:hypothetical protein